MRDQEEVSIHRTESRRESIPITGTRVCKGHNLGKLRNYEKTNVMAMYPHGIWGTTFTGWLPRLPQLF